MAHSSPAKVVQMVKKGPWSQMEDEMLMHLVAVYGPEQWMEISKDHGSRNAKQCRERYHQNLKPSINRGPISAEEGVVIERLHAEKGPKWAEISRALGGRSDNQVKNWYNGQKNRRTKMHAHSGQQVIFGGAQHSLSAVKPVDVHMLQQRGHVNPYSQSIVGYSHQSRLSPTTSQISEAPSLISDASSTSPGISPSSIIAYPACSSAWHLPEDPARTDHPSLRQLPFLPPPDALASNSFRPSSNFQVTRPATLERKERETGFPRIVQRGQSHVGNETQNQPSRLHELEPGQLPPVQNLLGVQHSHLPNMSPAAAPHADLACRPLPGLQVDQTGASDQSDDKPARSHVWDSSSHTLRPSNRHAPYPSWLRQATAAKASAPDDTTKDRMSLANVLG